MSRVSEAVHGRAVAVEDDHCSADAQAPSAGGWPRERQVRARPPRRAYSHNGTLPHQQDDRGRLARESPAMTWIEPQRKGTWLRPVGDTAIAATLTDTGWKLGGISAAVQETAGMGPRDSLSQPLLLVLMGGQRCSSALSRFRSESRLWWVLVPPHTPIHPHAFSSLQTGCPPSHWMSQCPADAQTSPERGPGYPCLASIVP